MYICEKTARTADTGQKPAHLEILTCVLHACNNLPPINTNIGTQTYTTEWMHIYLNDNRNMLQMQ